MKPFISINADKARNMRLAVRNVMKLEKDTGKSTIMYIEDFSERMEENKVLTSEIVDLLYLCLNWEDKELNKDRCLDIFDKMNEEYGYTKIIELIVECFQNYLGVDEDKVKEAKFINQKASGKKTKKK